MKKIIFILILIMQSFASNSGECGDILNSFNKKRHTFVEFNSFMAKVSEQINQKNTSFFNETKKYTNIILKSQINSKEDLEKLINQFDELNFSLTDLHELFNFKNFTSKKGDNSKKADLVLSTITKISPEFKKIKSKIISSSYINEVSLNYKKYIQSLKLKNVSKIALDLEFKIEKMEKRIGSLTDRQETANLLGSLFKARNKLARLNKFKNFPNYYFSLAPNNQLKVNDLKQFIKNTKKYILPVYSEYLLKKNNNKKLSFKDVKRLDPKQPSFFTMTQDEYLENAIKISDEMAPYFGGITKKLVDTNSIAIRPFSGMAFNFTLPTLGENKILMNSDIGNFLFLMHEVGHANYAVSTFKLDLNYYKSAAPGGILPDTHEFSAISFEYLSSKAFAQELNDDQKQELWEFVILARLKKNLLEALKFFEVELWAYSNPDKFSNSKELAEKWLELSKEYEPHIDWDAATPKDVDDSLSFIFNYKMFFTDFSLYIRSYAVARFQAAKLLKKSYENHDATMEKFIKMMKKGGTSSFRESMNTAGVPFNNSDKEFIGVAETFREILNLHEENNLK